MTSDFKLSMTIAGKESGIRDIAVLNDNLICTAEERGALTVWERKEGGTEFVAKAVNKLPHLHEKGLLFCVEAVYGDAYPAGTFISGGADKCARPFNIEGVDLLPLISHKNCVNSICQTATGKIVTGSWDGTAKIWQNEVAVKTLTGHEHAVEVLGLPGGQLVTASANKSIIIFDENGNVQKKILSAHNHTIRKLARHPMGFVSCGNDGFVRIWTAQGENLLSIDSHCLAEPTFVYGVCVFQNADMASCGEDGNVQIFSSAGTLLQTLRHPGPVRAVKALPNGDLLTACTDKCTRVFSRNPARHASQADLQDFANYISMITASGNMEALDTDTLPDESVLLQPGKKEGDIKVVKVDSKAMVFKWNGAKVEWEVFGEAVGQGGGKKKPVLDGVQYDHVTDVFLTEDRSVPLGFNKDDDPEDVATRFCALHGIPPENKQQIVNHVRPLTDSSLAAVRQLNDRAVSEATSLKHVPAWSTGGFLLEAEFKSQAFKSKVLQISEELGGPFALNEAEQTALSKFVRMLEEKANYHKIQSVVDERQLLIKLFSWPPASGLAVLDGFRAFMCIGAACGMGAEDFFQQKLLSFARGGTHTHASLVLKGLTNWIAKRERPALEWQRMVAPALLQYLSQALMVLTASADENTPASFLSAYTIFVYNLVVWLGRIYSPQALPLFNLISRSLLDILGRSFVALNDKTIFYALLTLGSVGYCDRDILVERAGELRLVLARLRERHQSIPLSAAVLEIMEDLARVFGV